MITTIIASVIGTICAAAIFAALKSRWLYVIAPKLYLNTPISDGQIVSLTIYNAGLLAEEDVAITFRSVCKFELIATSKSTLSVSGKTISIPKVSRLETITVLLLIEGKAFDALDIESIESRFTKGKVVESKENAATPWESMLALPVLILLVGVPFVLGTFVGAEMRVSAFAYVKEKLEFVGSSKQLAGFRTSLREIQASEKFEGIFKNSKVLIETAEVIRRGDVLTITLKISNNTKAPLFVDGQLTSSSGDRGPLDFWDGRVERFALGSGESRAVKLKAFLPDSLSVKIVEIRFSFENISGESAIAAQVLQFN